MHRGDEKREEGMLIEELCPLPSARLYYLLKRNGINTVDDLCGYTVDELKQIRGFGNGYAKEVESILDENGFSLKDTNDDGKRRKRMYNGKEQTEEQLEKYLSVTECSRLTGISIYAIRSLIKEGKIEAYMMGNKYMVKLSSFEQFLFGAKNSGGLGI